MSWCDEVEIIDACRSDSGDESEPGGKVSAHRLPDLCTVALLHYSSLSRFPVHLEGVAWIQGTSSLMLLGCGRVAQKSEADLMAVS